MGFVVIDVVVVVDVVVVLLVVDVVDAVVGFGVLGTVVVTGCELNISGRDVVNFSAIAINDGKSFNSEVIVVADV